MYFLYVVLIKEITPSLEIFQLSLPELDSKFRPSFLVLPLIEKIFKNSEAQLLINLRL